jgi:hypothetical protein
MSFLISISHAFLNIFAGGRSNTKVYLFFIYFAILILLTFIFKNKKISKNVKDFSKYTFFVSLIIGHILGAAVFLNYADQYGFDANDFTLTFNNGEVSSSQLSHNHVLKGSVGMILNLFSKGSYENIDAGLPFVGLIPNYILWLGLILILIATISSLIFFTALISEKTDRTKKTVFLIGFALATFSLLKAIADGGILLANSLPILAVLLFGVCENKRQYKFLAFIIFLYLIWTAIAWKNFFFEENYQLTIHLISGITPFAVLMIIFLLEKYAYKRATYLFGILVIFAAMSHSMYKEISDLSKYRNYVATNGIVGLYEQPNEVPGELKSTLGNLNFYKIEISVSVDDVIKQYNLLDNIYPVAVPWKTCVPTSFGDSYTFSLNIKSNQVEDPKIIGQNMDRSKLSQFNNVKIEFLEEVDGIAKYDVFVNIKPCLPRHLNVMQELLKNQFAEPFFVYNIEKK